MPTEAQMKAKDKYSMFDRKEKRYRKGVHSQFFLFPSFFFFFSQVDGGRETVED